MKKIKELLVRWSEKIITKFASKTLIDEIVTKLSNPKIITSLFKKILQNQNLLIEEKEIRVKKGKIRYTLFIVHTKANKLRFNLGRHYRNSHQIEV